MRHELSFVYDYGQVYLYDAAASSLDYLVDLCMPSRWNFDAPLVVEVRDDPREPDLDG